MDSGNGKLPDIGNIAGPVGKQPGPPAVQGFNLDGCYHVETYTDMAVSEIRVMIPVEPLDAIDGKATLPLTLTRRDRPIRFFSYVMANFDNQTLRIPFEIIADSLHDALTKFGDAAQHAGNTAIAQMRERQRATIVGANGARLN